jgi:hypothetical protein
MTIDYVGNALKKRRVSEDQERQTESPPVSPSVANVASVAWPVIDEAAYYGLAGDVVRTIEPHTEADPVAILIQVLTYFGNVIGRSPYYQVEADRHGTNLFGVLVGASSKARKGVSAGHASSVFLTADDEWKSRMKGGLSSGEGLINEVRDERREFNKKEGREEIVDPGVPDKRLMITEAEYANALAVMERPGNTLSPQVRNAWDGIPLSTMTKNSPLRATNPHISICGHITVDELRARLTRTDAANGYANRFLFALVRRSKVLPFGGNIPLDEIAGLRERIRTAVGAAKSIGLVTMTEEARKEWATVYADLSEGKPGLLGAVVARGEAQVSRVALIYALLDGPHDDGCKIDVCHLNAALAVWDYCESSAAYIFGDSLGDDVADELLRSLRQAGNVGMTRTAIRDLFARHRSGRVAVALGLLHSRGLARTETKMTGGRPSETWFPMGA